MASILDFTIHYKSDEEQLTTEMFFRPQVIQNKKISNFEPQIK